jgi:hypothetical protein
MEKRQEKRLIIIFCYLLGVGLIFYGADLLWGKKETCLDGIKNQNEEEIDCGGVCNKCQDKIAVKDIEIVDKGFVPGGSPGKFDFWGEISNPNSVYGAKKFDYEVVFKNSGEEIIDKKNGQNFILPGEKKYIILTNISFENLSSVDFSISQPDWVQFQDYYERPQLKIVNKNYSKTNSGVNFSEALGLLKNESPFDFNVISIGIILRDGDGNVLAVNSTEMRTIRSREEREFKAIWPNSFSGEVEKVEAFPEIDIFDSEAFFKGHIEEQKL